MTASTLHLWQLTASADVIDDTGHRFGVISVPFSARARSTDPAEAWEEISQEILVPDLGDSDELQYRGETLFTWLREVTGEEPRLLRPTGDGYDCRLFSVQLALVGADEDDEPYDEDGGEQ